jgi:hypothetical protein
LGSHGPEERRLSSRCGWPGRCFLALAIAGAGSSHVAAHVFEITDVLAVLKTDGTFQIDMTVDVDALALGVSPSTDSRANAELLETLSAGELEAAIERARATVLNRVRIRFDGEEPETQLEFPGAEAERDPAAPPSALGTTARLTGRIPSGVTEFVFGASQTFGPVQLTVLEQASLGGARYLMAPGDDSPLHRVGHEPPREAAPGTAARYLVLGFEHILPLGVDHVLFVLGLFLLSARLRPLMLQVTAFTVAHSVTLALSILGWVSLPSRIVETLIALSIAYVAIENLFTTELKPWRPALVFGFGLLHGLGFAGVLRELGLPTGELASALVAFNVGVELGQLAVVALAMLLAGWARNRPWYRERVTVPASVVIAAVGLWWAIERSVG